MGAAGCSENDGDLGRAAAGCIKNPRVRPAAAMSLSELLWQHPRRGGACGGGASARPRELGGGAGPRRCWAGPVGGRGFSAVGGGQGGGPPVWGANAWEWGTRSLASLGGRFQFWLWLDSLLTNLELPPKPLDCPYEFTFFKHCGFSPQNRPEKDLFSVKHFEEDVKSRSVFVQKLSVIGYLLQNAKEKVFGIKRNDV